ncbi:MAG: pyridoxamine 5'-phosphate oxidase family protein [Myxococcota bacterium]|nr:pyridoxamine 5'-phosphate oxidase family protein [Myxococcota bacterium]
MRADGTVEQSIVYYIRDGETLWISANPEGGKARDLRRDPRVSMLVYADDGSGYLAIEGIATVSDDVDTADRLELMSRYIGLERALAEVAKKPKARPNARIRVLPTRALAFNIPE